MTIKPNDLHFWCLETHSETADKLLKHFHNILSSQEQKHCKSFVFETDQRDQTLSKILTRKVLSSYFPLIAPKSWEFKKNKYGCPYLDHNSLPLPVHFNISHTPGMVVCLIGIDRNLGIDIENTTRIENPLEIIENYFSKKEITDLKEKNPSEQINYFYKLWTLKESYIKAKRMGLSIPLKDFAFAINHSSDISISFSSKIDDDPTKWSFKLFNPTPHHQLAISAEKKKGESLVFTSKDPAELL